MHILLDTHIYLWWLDNDKKLSSKAKSLITEAHVVYISTVTIWEIAIKAQIGKIETDINELIDETESQGFKKLPLVNEHVKTLLTIPYRRHDPFDRMLIAQAMSEPARFLTADKSLKEYSELVEVV